MERKVRSPVVEPQGEGQGGGTIAKGALRFEPKGEGFSCRAELEPGFSAAGGFEPSGGHGFGIVLFAAVKGGEDRLASLGQSWRSGNFRAGNVRFGGKGLEKQRMLGHVFTEELKKIGGLEGWFLTEVEQLGRHAVLRRKVDVMESPPGDSW